MNLERENQFSFKPWLALPARLILFTIFQSFFALGFFLADSSDSWDQSALYWPLGVIVTNLLCVIYLFYEFKKENVNYFSLFKFQREYIKKDVLLMLGILLLSVILSMGPNIGLAVLFFGDPQAGLTMMGHNMPLWIIIIGLVVLPVTQVFAEIPIYMVYIAPKLQKQGVRTWIAYGFAALFLSLQHIAMPLILDPLVIAYRGLMFLAFTILIAVVLYKRPRLLPYMVIIHGLMDLSLFLSLLIM